MPQNVVSQRPLNPPGGIRQPCPQRSLTPMKILLAILMGFAALSASAETVRISGVGLAAPLMQRLADMFQRQHPGDEVNVILPPLGSDGALRALRAGALELAVIGRTLKPEEMPNFGRVREVGRTALGFATRDGAHAGSLTPRDITAIYAGEKTRWDDGQPLRLIMRAERESDTQLVRSISPEVNAAMDAAFKRRGLVVAHNDLDMAKLLESTPGSFGPITTGLASLQGTAVHFLPFDGVQPGAKNVANGRYPLVKPLFVVEPPAPTPASQRFVSFLLSPAALAVLATADFAPPR